MTATVQIFTKISLGRQQLVTNSYTKFRENPTDDLVTGNWLQTDIRLWSAQGSNRCLLSDAHKTHKCTVWAEHRIIYKDPVRTAK
jgi:hypothetical protein